MRAHSISQRFDGIPKEVVDQDQARQKFISHLARQALNSPQKHEFMEELIPEEGRTFNPISDQSKKSHQRAWQRRSFRAPGTSGQDPVCPLPDA